MSIFDDVDETPYKLEVQAFGGARYVDARHFLDILEKRAILSLRRVGVPGIGERTADSERGRLAEIEELIKAIESYVQI